MTEEDVEVGFGASIEGFTAGVNSVKAKLEGLTGPITELQESFAGIGEAIAVAFAVEKVIDFVKEMAELGEQAVRTSEMLGMTTEAVTALQFATTVTGGSAGQMTSLLERLSRTMASAAEGGKSQIAAFKEAGVAYDDAEGHLRPLPEMLADIADRFKNAPDGPEKTALAISLMGRAGAEAIPLLNQGADGLEELRVEAEKAGVVLSGPVAEGMAKTADNNNKLGQALQGLGEVLFQIFEPGINAIVTAMTSWVEGMTEGLNNATLLQGGVEALAIAFDGVVAVIEVVIAAFRELWTVAEGIISGLTAGLTDLSKAMHDATTLNWGAVGGDLNDAWKDQVDNAKAHVKTMGDLGNELIDNITKMVLAQASGNAAAANSSGSPSDRDRGPAFIPPAKVGGPGGVGGATDKMDAARAEIDGEIKVLQQGLARKQALLNSELQMHQISEQEYARLSQQAVDAEYQAELALLNKELQINGLKLTQRQELLNKIKELEQKHAAEIEKIQIKAAEASAKAWQKVGDTIASAFNSQVSGLLKGSETVGQAIENIGLDLATQAIQNAVKSLMASAAQTFGGIFAFLAPVMGPAAAGPAAAGQAAVMAASAGIASLDVGTWNVPRDTMANIHAGETVMPAFESGQFRDMVDKVNGGGGGGDHYHTHNWNGPVMDKASLARAVSDMWDRNPSLRPAYR